MACSHELAVMSHASAAELLGLSLIDSSLILVSVPERIRRRLPGIRCHRRSNLGQWEITDIDGIPLTCPATTIVDVAPSRSPAGLEHVVNEADKLGLVDPETLRLEIDRMPLRPGKARVRELLDRHTFLLTDSELERRFIPIAERAGLPTPITGATVNGYKVDFYWAELGLVVETDGLRYHRTPATQARDRLRDQAHTAAGLTPLRLTHAQVRYQPSRVQATLEAVATRSRTSGTAPVSRARIDG